MRLQRLLTINRHQVDMQYGISCSSDVSWHDVHPEISHVLINKAVSKQYSYSKIIISTYSSTKRTDGPQFRLSNTSSIYFGSSVGISKEFTI
jgi:hypothetical protein